jgi:hypothetical protein
VGEPPYLIPSEATDLVRKWLEPFPRKIPRFARDEVLVDLGPRPAHPPPPACPSIRPPPVRHLPIRRPAHCHLISVAPTVNPAPTATSTMRSPRFTRPASTTSSSASGNVAAVVLP